MPTQLALGIKVLSRDRCLVGRAEETEETCEIDGCPGTILYVHWKYGTTTRCCTKGMDYHVPPKGEAYYRIR